MRGEAVRLVVGRDYAIRHVSRAPPGVEASELIGRRVWSLVPRRWREAVRRAHQAVFDAGQLTRLRLAAYHPDSSGLMHYECRAAPICRRGKPVAALVHAIPLDGRDILVPHLITFETLDQGTALRELLKVLRSFDADVLCELGEFLTPLITDACAPLTCSSDTSSSYPKPGP
jgi:hypothetical protein